MKYLGRVTGITRRYKVRNEDVRVELDSKATHRIESQQLRWFGPLNGMNENRLVKQL